MDLGKLQRTAPVKPEYAPTLPQLLAPRIDSLPRIVLRVVAAGAIVVAVAVILLAVRLRNPVFSYTGTPAFATSYTRAMTRLPVPANGPLLLSLEQRSSAGIVASFQIRLVHLPAYGGEISGGLPVVASAMIASMAAADPTFLPYSRGRTRINLVPGYSFTFQRYTRTHWWNNDNVLCFEHRYRRRPCEGQLACGQRSSACRHEQWDR